MSRRAGVGAQRRAGFRGIGGFATPPVALTAPVIAGAVTIGGSAAITPGTYSGSLPQTKTYTLYRGGVADGTEVSRTEAQAEAYLCVAADIGPTIVWRETSTNAAGSASQDSNSLQFTDLASLAPSLLLDERGLTVVGSKYSVQADQSGNGRDFMMATDASRPFTGRTIGGHAAVDYRGAERIASAAATPADIFTSTTSFMLAVVDIDAITQAATAATYYLGHTILTGDVTGYFALSFYDVAGVKKAAYGSYGTVGAAAETTVTVGLRLLQGRKAGTTVGIRLDAASEVTEACEAAYGAMTGLMAIGQISGLSSFLDGATGPIVCWSAAPSANVIATARAFLSYRYGVTS